MKTWILALSCLAAVACSSGKASESQCKKAVDNIRNIVGLDKADLGARPEAMVRSCRAQTTKASADCMIAAKTLEDLQKCEGETGAKFYADEEQREKQQREKNAENDKKTETEDKGGW